MKVLRSTSFKVCLGSAISLGMILVVARGLDWGEVWTNIRDIPLQNLCIALILFLMSNFARAYRWKLLFFNARISVVRLFLIENIGLGVNNLVPLRIASEVTQLALLTLRDNIERGMSLATLGMTRILDIWASTVIVAIGLMLVPGAGGLARYAIGGFVLSLLLLALVRFLSWNWNKSLLVQRIPVLGTLIQSIAGIEQRKGRLLASLAVSLGHWLLLGLSAWVVAIGMDLPVSLAQIILVILATILFATSVPALPGAIGTFEAAMVYVLGLFDIDRDLVFPYALTMHLMLFAPSTLIAVIFLPREGFGSIRKIPSMIQNLKDHAQA